MFGIVNWRMAYSTFLMQPEDLTGPIYLEKANRFCECVVLVCKLSGIVCRDVQRHRAVVDGDVRVVILLLCELGDGIYERHCMPE